MPFLNWQLSGTFPARTPTPTLKCQAIEFTGNDRLVPIRCRECQVLITRTHIVLDNGISVSCLVCLAKHPKGRLAQRLKAYRLAARSLLGALAKRCGNGLAGAPPQRLPARR